MLNIRYRARWAVIAGGVTLATAGMAGCSNLKDQLLEPQNPGVIDPSAVTSPSAADALRIGALGSLKNVTSGAGGETLWIYGGLLTDEWKSSDTFLQRNETDQRSVQTNNGNINTAYQSIQQSRGFIRDAIVALNTYLPEPKSNIAEMFFALGFVEMTMAEDLCNGIPLGVTKDRKVDYSDPSFIPLTNAEVYAKALAHFDSALTFATATDAKTVSVRNAILVAKARTLINTGQFAAAAALVPASVVPTSYQYIITFSTASTSDDNSLWSLNVSAGRYTLADSVDPAGVIKNAVPFVSAKDPRVPSTNPNKKGFDGNTALINQAIWGRDDGIPLVSGIDARLIEAEAKLNADDFAGMMTILNALRTSAQTIGTFRVPVMTSIGATPATKDAATTLFFREKAFWTFGRGQRLADERRLVRIYKRPQDQVFPVGAFFKNGIYGIDVNLPVTDTEKANPNFKGCLDRNA